MNQFPVAPTSQKPEPGTYASVPLQSIVSSKTNPRKSFNQDKLNELAATIKDTGVHTPILLRYLPPDRLQDTFADRKPGQALPEYEIVAGERRYRASAIAGVATIPAIIRAMSDAQALEIQLIENLQRDDLSELEEAEGYQQLCDLTNISKEAIADKIRRSRRYVYQRLALLKLQPLAKDALRQGKISYTAALAISQVHDGDLQAKALAYASTTDGDGDKISTRRLQTWISANVMLALNKAPFDIKSTDLRIIAGSCTACPKRTGADPDLFAAATGPDSCCDAPCYHIKSDAARLQALDKFKAQGIPIMNADQADSLHTSNGGFRNHSAVSQTRNDTASGKPATLLDLLGKKGQAAVGLVAIEHPQTKQVRVYVDTAKAEGWLLGQGLIVDVEAEGKKGKESSPAVQLKDLVRQRDSVKRGLQRIDIGDAVIDAIDSTADDDLAALLTPELVHAFVWVNTDDCEQQVTPAQNMRALLLELVSQTITHGFADDTTSKKTLAAAESILLTQKVTVGDVIANADSDQLRGLNERIAALQAKIKPTQPPAGAAYTGAGGEPKTDAKPNAKPKPKKQKLSAQEVQLGIADAMQDIEEVAANAAAFTIGQRVKIVSAAELHLQKYVGTIGKIKKAVNGNWDVIFHGRGIAEFEPAELVPA